MLHDDKSEIIDRERLLFFFFFFGEVKLFGKVVEKSTEFWPRSRHTCRK